MSGFALYINGSFHVVLCSVLISSLSLQYLFLDLSLSLSLSEISIMEDGSRVRIGRKSSIESEPRTLGFNQIQYAREVAEYVMNTRNIEEARRIFTKGLQPVASVMKQNMMMDSVDDFEFSEDHLRSPGLRDVATAPF